MGELHKGHWVVRLKDGGVIDNEESYRISNEKEYIDIQRVTSYTEICPVTSGHLWWKKTTELREERRIFDTIYSVNRDALKSTEWIDEKETK